MLQRRHSNSPILDAIGTKKKNKNDKSFHTGRGAIGPGKGRQGGPQAFAKQQQEQLDESTVQDLVKELQRQTLQQAEPKDSAPQDIDFKVSSHALLRTGSWKAKVAHQSRNAVVKILSSVVEFDWEQPYRRADDAQAIGSGFFVSNDGIIVTNAHVVEEAAKVWITVPSEGEKRFDAEVIGVCFDADIALLRSKGAPVRTILEFGDSDEVQYGQEVLTLGYPLGMDSLKLTEGIISGRQEGLFQTDAPLNPGNSGGPMLNEEGKVIGINVAIVEQSQNVGFAIPVHNLTMLYESLKSRPKGSRVIHKPILGADFSNTSDALQEFKECPGYTGIYINKAYEGFPLYNAGVRDGDILHHFNGYALDNFGEAEVPWSPYARASVDVMMALLDQSSKPEIEYSHEGKMIKATLNFEDPKKPGYPILPSVREFYPPYEKIDHEVVAGIVVMELTINHIQLFHDQRPSESVIRFLTPIAASFAERLQPALVVTNVMVGSLTARCDIFQIGTLLCEVNGIKVKTLQEFREAMLKPVAKKSGKYITLMSKQNELVVLPFKDSLKEEFELSEIYMFNPSSLVLKNLQKNEDLIDYVAEEDKHLKAKIKASISALQQQEEEEKRNNHKK